VIIMIALSGIVALRTRSSPCGPICDHDCFKRAVSATTAELQRFQQRAACPRLSPHCTVITENKPQISMTQEAKVEGDFGSF
jgi:hypothetical protein